MDGLGFLFLLVPGLILAFSALIVWGVLRQQRQIRRDLFGGTGSPLFVAPQAGPRYHTGQGGTDVFPQEADSEPYSSHSSWEHGSSHHDHGSSYDFGSGYDSSGSGSSSSSSYDSGGSSSSDSGSSSW